MMRGVNYAMRICRCGTVVFSFPCGLNTIVPHHTRVLYFSLLLELYLAQL